MNESLLKIGIIVILIYIICYLNNNNQQSEEEVKQQMVQKQQVVEGFDGHLQQQAAQQRQKAVQGAQQRQKAVQGAQQRQPAAQQRPQQKEMVRASQGNLENVTVAQQQAQQKQESQIRGQSRQVNEGAATPQGVESASSTQGIVEQSNQKQKVDAAGNVINTCGNDILTSAELLPSDAKSTWSEVTPVNPGGLENKNFLDAGFHIGINTVGQSLRNANRQLRSDPPIPKVEVSIWNRSTIESDDNRRPLEIGGACEN